MAPRRRENAYAPLGGGTRKSGCGLPDAASRHLDLGRLHPKYHNRSRRYTVVTQLRLTGAPIGSKVTISCSSKRKGCRSARKSITVKSGRPLQLAKYLRTAELKKGATVTVLVTRPGNIGAHVRYTIRDQRVPSKRLRCVEPGETTPRTACT